MENSQKSPSVTHSKQRATAKQLLARVAKCWEIEFECDLVPPKVREVCKFKYNIVTVFLPLPLISVINISKVYYTFVFNAGMSANQPSTKHPFDSCVSSFAFGG